MADHDAVVRTTIGASIRGYQQNPLIHHNPTNGAAKSQGEVGGGL